MTTPSQSQPRAAGEAAHIKTLPWRVEPEYALVGAPMFISIAPFDHNGSGRTVAFAEAPEAAFIVRACNSHAALVGALESMTRWHENRIASLEAGEPMDTSLDGLGVVKVEVYHARAILAQAK